MSYINKINQIDIGNVNRLNTIETTKISKVGNDNIHINNYPTNIGEFYEGGYYFGNIIVNDNTYGLLCAPKLNGELRRQWKTSLSNTSGTDSLIDGYTNTYNMNNTTHPAAYFCGQLSLNGYNDWYSPSKNELALLYNNHTVLEESGSGIFEIASYWSSTQYSNYQAWQLYFGNGTQDYNGKDNNNYVRAIRRFLII